MQISFRELSAHDIDACSGIIKEIYTKEEEQFWQDTVKKDLSDVLSKAHPSKCLLAIKDKSIVGFGCYIKIPDSIFYKLSWINILPKEQGNGIGKKLINELEKNIIKECRNAFSVILETDKPYFYNKLGYEIYNHDNGKNWMQKQFMSHPKILIGTLFSEVKDYCIKEWFKNVCQFTYPFDLCLVDNSKDKKYHKKMFKYFSEHKKNSNIGKLTVLHTPRVDKKSEIFMTFSANEIRKYFLKGDYDKYINLESDIFPNPNIIERLLCYNKPVIGATYFSGEKKRSYPMIQDSCIHNVGKNAYVVLIPYIRGFYEMTDAIEAKPCFGQGIGCVMINRDVIEKIPFRSDNRLISHYDLMFYCDLVANGIQNYLAPIICRHENQTWDIQNKMIG